MPGKELSIIIVNFNGVAFLGNCLNSIKEKVKCNYEVIVVDNASTDNSCDYISVNYPEVILIKSPVNLGFAAGTNWGAKIANGRILLLLNNDTILLTDINPALDLLASNSEIGVVGCKMYYKDGRLQYSCGYEHIPLRIVLSWIGLKKYECLPDLFRREFISDRYYQITNDNVSWVSGAFMATRRSLWEVLNGFNESYFMYMEDVDYCKRIIDLGLKVVFIPNVEIIHFEGSGKKWIGPAALKNTVKSYLIYTRKYYGDNSVFLIRYGLTFIFLLRSIVYLLLSFIKKSDIFKEKFTGYIKVIKFLINEK